MALTAGSKATADNLNSVATDYIAQSVSGDQTVTTTETDLAGTSVSVTTPVANTEVKVTAIIDINATGATDLSFVICHIAGAAQTGNCKWQVTGRGMITQQWVATIAAAGTHTIKLRCQKILNIDAVTIYGTHSKIIVEGNGI